MEFFSITVHNDPGAAGPYSQLGFTRARETLSSPLSPFGGIRQTTHAVDPTFVLRRRLAEHDHECRERQLPPDIADKTLKIVLQMDGFTEEDARIVREGGRLQRGDPR